MVLPIACAEQRRFVGEHLTECRLLTARTLVHSPSLLDLRWFLGAPHPTAPPAAGAELVRAYHLLSSYQQEGATALQTCCSGGHRTTILLLRRPSHNYCYSGDHRTAAAPAAIAPLSSFPSISASISTPAPRGRHGDHRLQYN